ncbi:MAG TPA: hypothetical protein VHA09_01435 [Nitrososphaera sp.]|nr:hypothetical protein [Nitrososphaera sp.]
MVRRQHQHVQDAKEEEIIADLRSLGVDPRRKTELNNNEELAELADNLKQSMLQDYKTAYSDKGQKVEQETKATVDQ